MIAFGVGPDPDSVSQSWSELLVCLCLSRSSFLPCASSCVFRLSQIFIIAVSHRRLSFFLLVITEKIIISFSCLEKRNFDIQKHPRSQTSSATKKSHSNFHSISLKPAQPSPRSNCVASPRNALRQVISPLLLSRRINSASDRHRRKTKRNKQAHEHSTTRHDGKLLVHLVCILLSCTIHDVGSG